MLGPHGAIKLNLLPLPTGLFWAQPHLPLELTATEDVKTIPKIRIHDMTMGSKSLTLLLLPAISTLLSSSILCFRSLTCWVRVANRDWRGVVNQRRMKPKTSPFFKHKIKYQEMTKSDEMPVIFYHFQG